MPVEAVRFLDLDAVERDIHAEKRRSVWKSNPNFQLLSLGE